MISLVVSDYVNVIGRNRLCNKIQEFTQLARQHTTAIILVRSSVVVAGLSVRAAGIYAAAIILVRSRVVVAFEDETDHATLSMVDSDEEGEEY